MPGGRFDSSKTRVAPVFDALRSRAANWIPEFLALAEGACGSVNDSDDLTLLEGHWYPKELCLHPPVSLLSWCVRNANRLVPQQSVDERRRKLIERDPATISEALRCLRTQGEGRAWYIFEGMTCPDAVLVTPDALVVIEGKRPEARTTTDTTWLAGRHQIWRHIDAAWEIRGNRSVYGLFVVESSGDSTAVPERWKVAAVACLDETTLQTSFPHRSANEVEAISKCYLGITTWRHVCERFAIDCRALPK